MILDLKMVSIDVMRSYQSMPQFQIRILIVDDYEVVRRGLAVVLADHPDFMLVGEASNGLEAVDQCARLSPDIVLMDLLMPKMDGFQATRIIRASCPDIHVIALSSSSDPARVTSAIQAGATSYLVKNIASEELATAIRAAYDGSRTLSPEATQALINAAVQPPAPNYTLTAREIDVLRLMVDGMTNPAIAQHLSVSRSTVKYHISAILSKLGVANRSEAVACAFKYHLV